MLSTAQQCYISLALTCTWPTERKTDSLFLTYTHGTRNLINNSEMCTDHSTDCKGETTQIRKGWQESHRAGLSATQHAASGKQAKAIK